MPAAGGNYHGAPGKTTLASTAAATLENNDAATRTTNEGKSTMSRKQTSSTMCAAAFAAVAGLAAHTTAAQTDSVRFVPDVAGQFDSLTVRPDAMGFYIGNSPNPTSCKHYQGIVRLDAPDGTPYFYVARSGNIPPLNNLPDAQACGEVVGSDDPGNVLVVRMDSRDPFGERLRSNRIQRGLQTQSTPPDPGDTTVAYFTLDGTGDWPNYGHPGGMQAVGDVVALALEAPYEPDLPETAVLFFDAGDRESPEVLSIFDPCSLEALTPTCESTGVHIGLVGLTPLADGRFLMVVTGKVNETLWFFESVGTDLKSPALEWTFVDAWSEAEDEAYLGSEWPTETGAAHQTLNFLREGSIEGTLYLAGARGKIGFGEDHLDLYRVDRVNGEIKLKFISNKHENAHPALDGTILSPYNNVASFAAASAFYVSPSGELIFYATEHDNDGPVPTNWPQPLPCIVPNPWQCGSVKMGEWRHVQMVRPGSPTYLPSARVEAPVEIDEGTDVEMTAVGIPAITKAWVQLWAGDEFSGRYLVMDYDDRNKDNFDDFKDLDDPLTDLHFGFDNEPSSMLAHAPVGCTMRVNDDDFGDGDFPGEYTRTLPGTNSDFIAPHLSQVRNDGDTGSIDEELTSAQFFADCDAYYSAPIALMWDLEDDGTYDVAGNSATVSGDTTDGPSELRIRVRATHPTNPQSSASLTRVTVRNVAPTITSLHLRDSLGQEVGTDVPFVLAGLPLTLEADFVDPGRVDSQAADIAWGDGAFSTDADLDEFRDGYGSGIGTLADAHTYADPGDYTIELHVQDDDGGVAARSGSVAVATAEEAISAVIAAIDAIVAAGNLSPEVADALEDVRRALDGSNDGEASNGAIDKLDPASVQAALVKLSSALDSLALSEDSGAGDLSALENILLLVIQLLAAEG
jgi:hypothetical protein